MSPPITWTFQPSVLVGMLALALAYGYAWQAARAPGMPHPPGYGRLALFCGGELTIAVALISPVDGIARYLLFMHMVQHVLLLDIAPILLILSLTKGILRPVARQVKILEGRAGFVAHPAFAVVMYVGFMYFWHIPSVYDTALRYNNIHILEHLCFSAAGTLYWWHLISPIRSHMRFGGTGPVIYMTATKLLVGVLGVGLAFAPATSTLVSAPAALLGTVADRRPEPGGPGDGARAVDRDGHRDGLPVRAHARRKRAGGATAREVRGGRVGLTQLEGPEERGVWTGRFRLAAVRFGSWGWCLAGRCRPWPRRVRVRLIGGCARDGCVERAWGPPRAYLERCQAVVVARCWPIGLWFTRAAAQPACTVAFSLPMDRLLRASSRTASSPR